MEVHFRIGLAPKGQQALGTALSSVLDGPLLKGRTAKWTTVVALQGEGIGWDDVSASQAGPFAFEDVVEKGQNVIHDGFSGWGVPTFDQGRPIFVHAHQGAGMVQYGRLETWCGVVEGMQQWFVYRKSKLAQIGHQNRYRGSDVIKRRRGLRHRHPQRALA